MIDREFSDQFQVAFADRLNRAGILAGPARRALVRNHVGHCSSPSSVLLSKYYRINNPDYFFLFTYKYEHSRNRSHFFTFMENIILFNIIYKADMVR